MWLLLFLFVFQATPSPCQTQPVPTQPASLVVQVVDPNWYPIPDALVTLKPLDAGHDAVSNQTDDEGFAKFYGLTEGDFDIEIKEHGFKDVHLKHVHLFASPTAYIQLKLSLSSAGVTVY